MKKISIIVPIYNERRTIESIINALEEVNFAGFEKDIILIDDGSTDETRDILKKYQGKHKVFFHNKNRGKGAAIRTGLGYFSGEYVIIQDADLEYDPNDIARMLSFAVSNNAQVIYGSRMLKKNKKSSIIFYAGGALLTFITNVLYGLNITDEPTCYKMFHKSVIDKIKISSSGFEFCPEITAKVANLKIPIHEMPISYNPRSREMGKKIGFKDFFIAVFILVKYKLKKND